MRSCLDKRIPRVCLDDRIVFGGHNEKPISYNLIVSWPVIGEDNLL
jgi:hypothetical protein